MPAIRARRQGTNVELWLWSVPRERTKPAAVGHAIIT